MSRRDWSRVVKLQDQIVQEDNKQLIEHQHKMKGLYKHQLDKMIELHRRNQNNQKIEDKKIMKVLDTIEESKLRAEIDHHNKLHQVNENNAKDNLRSLQFRRQKTEQQIGQQKQFFHSYYKRTLTEVQQQKRQKMKSKEEKKKQLSIAYDDQLSLQNRRKSLQKMEDEKFSKLQQQVEQKKERDRQNFLHKIRNYHQNPQVYELSQHVMKSHKKQRQNFLSKMISQNNQKQIIEQIKKKQEEKYRQSKEVSSFNRQYFQERAFQNRHQSLKEVQDYSKRWENLEKQLEDQRRRQQKQKEDKKRLLQIELDKQIEFKNQEKQRMNTMDSREYSINKSDRVPVSIPGIAKDHTILRQQKILQKFLRNPQY